MKLIKLTLFLGLTVLFNTSCQQNASTSSESSSSSTSESNNGTDAASEFIFQKLTAAEFKAQMEETTGKSHLIDVRTPEEFAAGHIEGATNINFYEDNFADQIAQLDKDATVFVYCQAGGRSRKASNLFKENGFKEIYDLKVGYGGWSK